MLNTHHLLRAYASGIFPMAQSRDDPEIFWLDPKFRGIFPLDSFHISRSLRKRILSAPYSVTLNRDFEGVLRSCAARPETWINDQILTLYLALHRAGHAHSIEVWEDNILVGGVYGVAIGAAFFGESMFSHRTDASKIALAYLIDRLRLTGFMLFDTQFITPHLARLGAIEIPRAEYRVRLADAIATPADLTRPLIQSPYDVMQRNAQTS
ncbi:MAG: leucyl/phenylalanyl-tRNA--protein transferase [Paracoccaceae bacterium]